MNYRRKLIIIQNMQKKYLMEFALMTMIKTHRGKEELDQNDTSHMQLSMMDKYIPFKIRNKVRNVPYQ